MHDGSTDARAPLPIASYEIGSVEAGEMELRERLHRQRTPPLPLHSLRIQLVAQAPRVRRGAEVVARRRAVALEADRHVAQDAVLRLVDVEHPPFAVALGR